MAQYLIESPHTDEECVKRLDELAASGSDMLDKFVFGCMSGQHTGWALVEASSESEAMGMVPSGARSRAHVTKVDKFTPEQIKAFHGAH